MGESHYFFFYFSTLFSLFSFKCFLSKYTKVHLDLLEKSLVWDFANKNFLSLEIRSGFQFQASRADRENDVSDGFPNSIGKET